MAKITYHDQDPIMDEIDRKYEKEKTIEALEKSKKDCQEQKAKIVDKYIEFLQESEQNPEAEWQADMMETFLDAIIQMEAMMKTLDAVNTVTEFMGSMLNYVDDTQKLMLSVFNTQNQGFFESLKQRRQIKKAIKGNIRKMKNLTFAISGMSEMSQNIVNSFRQTAERMKLITAKSREKARKKREKELKKRGLDPNTPAPMSAAKRMALEIMKARAEAAGTDATTSGSSTSGGFTGTTGATPTSTGKGGVDVAIDDIMP